MPKGVYDRRSEVQRFWDMVDKREDNECWEWVGSLDSDGYGWFSTQSISNKIATEKKQKKTTTAHRYSALMKYGDLGDNMVRHTCDNRKCVNPEHLILGTAKDNSRDMVERNRSLVGEKNANSALSDIQAKEILVKYQHAVDNNSKHGILKRLSIEYKVSKQVIYRVTSKQCYSHIQS